MRHPWQTDTFDPGDPALIDRVQAGQRLHEGFRIGATAYEVDGDRWISMHGPYPYPCPVTFSTPFYRHLAYPLPEAYGADPFEAMDAFEREWHREKTRLWELQPVPPGSSPIQVTPKTKRPAKGRVLALAGALPLPGLEPWTGFGRQG